MFPESGSLEWEEKEKQRGKQKGKVRRTEKSEKKKIAFPHLLLPYGCFAFHRSSPSSLYDYISLSDLKFLLLLTFFNNCEKSYGYFFNIFFFPNFSLIFLYFLSSYKKNQYQLCMPLRRFLTTI